MTPPEWPHVRTYRGPALTHVKMPVGGIGTGCVSFGGRGQLADWQLFNRPSMSLQSKTFFAIHIADDQQPQTRALEGALSDADFAGAQGSTAQSAGLPRFKHSTFSAAYPLGAVSLSDPTVPITATVQAFNPLIPGDANASGIPALVYRATVTNPTSRPQQVAVCGNLENIIGAQPGAGAAGWQIPGGNSFTVNRAGGAWLLSGHGDGVDTTAESAGTLTLAAVGDEPSSIRTKWADRPWGDSLLDFWDDFSHDGQLDEPAGEAGLPVGSLVVTKQIPPGASADFTFVIGWHFPNRYGWSHHYLGPTREWHSDVLVGNHYASTYTNADDVIAQVAPQIGDLEQRTVDFVAGVVDSGIPTPLADAALSNLAVLKSPVCFRIADGTFMSWEGSHGDHGSCHGSCTHVWNYQYALESLFPDLAWTMRTVEFVHALDPRGKMSFRAGLPLETEGTGWTGAAADGQMGAIVRLHRLHRLSPDTGRLRDLWPAVRKAMEFAWIPRGWDADMDGLMEGCQHNTADVEYYGPSGVNQSWYLAALAACIELAREAGDHEFADTCGRVLHSGCTLTDKRVFNGEYYQHEVIPPMSAANIADGLRLLRDDHTPVGSADLVDPDFQIGPGCTTDQLAGYTMAVLGNLHVPLSEANIAAAADSIDTHNHRTQFYDHFNHRRTYALNDEAGLLNCSYPRGDRPARPFPYCDEVWTGLEYTAAIGHLLLGSTDTALRIVTDVRNRYDGSRRNPFDEVECGHHYIRSMASWGLVEAWNRISTTAPDAAQQPPTTPADPLGLDME